MAVLAAVVMALGPGRDTSSAGSAAATGPASPPAVTSRATESPTPSPKVTAGSRTPTPTASRTSKRPSATTPAAGKPAAGSAAALAGRIRPGVAYQGSATFYDAGDGDGACSFGPAGEVLTAAMNSTDYETAKACGAHVRVRAANGATVTVRITNECPTCRTGQLDLSAAAFARLAAPVKGQIPVTWQLVSPGAAQPLSLRYKTGSSRYWCGIQALGHRNPVARLEVRTGGVWRALPRTDYNYFLAEDGRGCGGDIRLTDIYGERLVFTGIAIRPNTVQATRAQFAAR
ncbi:expansin EXLX1 family cellulose-binding protein [Streptomyces indicus]|uniref:Peptidoglycan-binding domain-containing protein, expansin n=1 Tax=Streptomyces indicus TaxID=417292 RepID=A0A1G8T591_9ACTN|nr:expansin EXLX1 family cellulose-binding protein [Streptomyces indicus]SDJ36676.1 Peptidoglycan-binding domain-containing protein, expansin [Streptomyces indicus]